ncbi:alpha/beta hydrolase [Salisediminibacterium beveridgei]|uniref:Alpha/Beta Fold Family Hydrolase n=1 Tax=Salisediminibacterium beveridgei TaxID=632773 RepID=A0A1D7QT70_9BACI|nr:alpha/beta hydrolase [Salisediminibacterium beveridgei]AOM82223.1 Alpha/Beta Fold Family Hydrolase [Salisediminibacterium beveridgei]
MRTSLFTFSDGYTVPYYEWESPDQADVVVLGIHGITPDLDEWMKLAGHVTESGPVDVHLPVLRGYKPNKKNRGDIPLQEQYDQDLSEMITELNQEYERVIVMGHSAGCGNVMRLLNRQTDAFEPLLLAPFIHPEMKVFREQEKTENDPSYKIFNARAVAAHTLTRFRLRFAERIPVVRIPLREQPLYTDSEIHPFTLSYRLMMGRFLDPAYSKPLFSKHTIPIIIGEHDEVIDAEKLTKYVSEVDQDQITVIPGADHNSIFHDQASLAEIIQLLSELRSENHVDQFSQ